MYSDLGWHSLYMPFCRNFGVQNIRIFTILGFSYMKMVKQASLSRFLVTGNFYPTEYCITVISAFILISTSFELQHEKTSPNHIHRWRRS